MISETLPSLRCKRGGCVASRFYWMTVACAILTAAVLRFAALDHYPMPIHQDELSNIYDGYSLATTGADRAGDRWPLIIRGVGPGDYRPALYAYLAAATTGLWGFSTWAGRFPAAVIGVVTVILVFLLGRRLLGPRGGFIALVFAAFSPILIQYARQAHEGASLGPFFAILVVYLLCRVLDSGGTHEGLRTRLLWTAGAGLAIGLSTSAYGAQRLTAPLLALLGTALILWQIGWRERSPRAAISAMLVLTLTTAAGAVPQLLAMLEQPEHFFVRARAVAHDWHFGPRWYTTRLIEGYLAHFHPRNLFFSFGEYAELTVARLSLAALPFVYVGLAAVIYGILVRRRPQSVLVLMAVLICILPAAASKNNHGILRASGVWALYPVICALGVAGAGTALCACWRHVPVGGLAKSCRLVGRSERRATLATGVLVVLIAGAGVRNIWKYLATPEWHNPVYQNHLVKVGEWLENNGREHERIYIDTPGIFAYLYVVAFSGLSPSEYQRAPREGSVNRFGWETFHHFGRFRFAELSTARSEWAASDRNESWLYLGPEGETIVFCPAGVTGGQRTFALAPSRP